MSISLVWLRHLSSLGHHAFFSMAKSLHVHNCANRRTILQLFYNDLNILLLSDRSLSSSIWHFTMWRKRHPSSKCKFSHLSPCYKLFLMFFTGNVSMKTQTHVKKGYWLFPSSKTQSSTWSLEKLTITGLNDYRTVALTLLFVILANKSADCGTREDPGSLRLRGWPVLVWSRCYKKCWNSN